MVRLDGRRFERADRARNEGSAAVRALLLYAGELSGKYRWTGNLRVELSMATTEKIQATQDELRQKGVKYCIGAYVDIHGVPKAKVVPLDHLHHMAHGSELYTGYALDGLGQQPNEDEIASVPDLDRIIQLPWEPKVAWMAADNTFHGKPYALNTRVALKNVL